MQLPYWPYIILFFTNPLFPIFIHYSVQPLKHKCYSPYLSLSYNPHPILNLKSNTVILVDNITMLSDDLSKTLWVYVWGCERISIHDFYESICDIWEGCCQQLPYIIISHCHKNNSFTFFRNELKPIHILLPLLHKNPLPWLLLPYIWWPHYIPCCFFWKKLILLLTLSLFLFI